MHPKLSQVTGTLAPWSHFFSGELLLAQGVFQLGSKNVIVSAGLAFNNFVIVAIVVAALYFTREILVPIALAVLLVSCWRLLSDCSSVGIFRVLWP